MNTTEINVALDHKVLAMDGRQGQVMIEAVHRFLSRFISYPSKHAHVAHALWIVHSHLMDLWESTPRLAFLSAEPASGKTRALEVTELLVPNPVVTVNVSPAYLFRKVGSEDGATILFDEVDTLFGAKAKDHEEIRGLLNAGHRRGATTGRCVVRGSLVMTEELPAYAAVALAGIGWLPDTLLTRSVIIRMRRRHLGEPVEPFRRRIHEAEGWRIREMVEIWAKSMSAEITWPDLPAQITDRDADVWEPLIAIADVIGGEWPARAREAGMVLVADAKEVEPSLGIRLLSDMRSVFGEATEMSSKTLLARLHDIAEAPWSEIRGKPLDERGLASRLRQYGIRSKTVRADGATPKGYTRADLVDVWKRYLPSLPEKPATSATGATAEPPIVVGRNGAQDSENQPPSLVADVADVAFVGRLGRACAHCQKSGGFMCEASVAGEPLWLHVRCKDAYRP
jgi:hypothetical protein